MIEVKDFIDSDDAENYEENELGGLGGFFEKGMRLGDYKSCFQKKYYNQLENLRKSIISANIRCGGDMHQQGFFAVPLWNDNTVSTYSFRAWGDLMASIWSTEENIDYSYMDFYMECLIK